MSDLNSMFKQLELVESENAAKAEGVRAQIREALDMQFKDWQALQTAVSQLESFEDVEYFGDQYGDIHSFIRFDGLSSVAENEREYLEGYLADCGISADWANDTLSQCLGNDCITIQDEHGRDNGVYQGFKQIIETEAYTDDDGEQNEATRNELIETHMERTGCFPGVFRVTRHGDVYPVETQPMKGA